MKIWKILNRLHKLDFWKKSKNFEMNFNDRDRKEFIGLRNMSSTCYMNSILQQFFMIPMLRETILNIKDDNTSKYNDDNDDINQIYSLIKNIDMIENNKNKAKIFKKKNMIRIVNHIKNKIKIRNNNNNINKIIYIKNIQKSPFAKLLSAISYFGNNKDTNTQIIKQKKIKKIKKRIKKKK